MIVEAVFQGCRSVFLDAAPTIYFLSDASPFYPIMVRAVAHCAAAGILFVASPVTLAECLAGEQDPQRQRVMRDFLTTQVAMASTDARIAEEAATLRRTTKLKLPDCLQLATALVAGCDAFLTNDAQLAKTSVALRFVLVSDLT